MIRFNQDPEFKRKQIEGSSRVIRRLNADPEFRKKIDAASSERMKRQLQDPEFCTNRDNAARAMLAVLNADPVFRAKQAASTRTPEARASRSKNMKRLHQDPRFRTKAMQANKINVNTKPELFVKAKLDNLGVYYEHPYNLNNKFFVDFYLPDFNTMIEVDGCYWHKCKECGFGDGRPRDRARNAYILTCGYRLEIIKEHELK